MGLLGSTFKHVCRTKEPIGAAVVLLVAREKILPYVEEVVASVPIGSSNCCFGATGSVGAKELRTGLIGPNPIEE